MPLAHTASVNIGFENPRGFEWGWSFFFFYEYRIL